MAADRTGESLSKLVRILRGATEVLTTAAAALTAALVVVETYQALRKKIDAGNEQ